MIETPQVERQLPHGVADLYLEDAARKTKVEQILRETFARWSYTEVIPPTFEYYEALASEASPQVREEIYRFADRDGRMLALRADPTIPIARIVSTKLAHHPLPLRFFYISNVFRYEEPRAALRREFTQAGVELIGAGTPQADAEVIALAVTALRAMGLGEFRVRVGAMNYVAALLDDLGLTEGQFTAIKSALERKNTRGVADQLRDIPIPPERRRALAALPLWTGGEEIIDQALRDGAVNANAEAALERLKETYGYLRALGCADAITLDLAMVRGMAYYTGAVFEGFARGIGFPVMSGGRYDDLLAHFGRPLPALGFAIGVERALAALAAQEQIPVDLSPEVVAELSSDPTRMRVIVAARETGKRVEINVHARSRDELREYARQRGAREVWFSDGTRERLE